ncbi:MAG: MBOAT family protein [Bacteroidales bacterium]|nr:MBOAT family protein [Bacteroidales bacterium]
MLFNSIEFLIFLPIVFLLYWFVFDKFLGKSKHKLMMQNAFVVVASYVFYGWWDWRFLLLIALTSVCSWLSGILMHSVDVQQATCERYYVNPKIVRKRKLIAATNIVINLAILATFKYYDFFATELATLFGLSSDGILLNIILPVGISFYTFQALSYSIDVYRHKIEPTKDIVAFFAFISFFPQLVAGPIERATNLLPQFLKKREFDYATAVDGCRQILWGLFKKVVVADGCADIVNNIFSHYATVNGATLFIVAILFSFQIYGDFSGYSDIAIGVAKLFGIRLMRNFNVPYFSRDIAEFWRRWHISLTTWFRDYVYIPMGGSRVSKVKVIRNTFIIFLVSGFWHGANWTFIAWGAFHAILFMPLILLGRNRKNMDVVASGKILPTVKEIGQMLLTFVLVVLGWVIFRSETIGDALQYFSAMFDSSFFDFRKDITVQYKPMLKVIIFIVFMLLIEWHNRNKAHGLDLSDSKSLLARVGIYYLLIFLILMFGANPAQFIYFQF